MRRIQYRLLAIIIFIGVIGMIMPIMYTNTLALNQAKDTIINKLRSHSNTFIIYAQNSEKDTFQKLAEEYSIASKLRVTLIAADGTVIGQIKVIVHDVDGGNSILAVTDALGFADLDFVDDGDTAMLMWTGTTGWAILSQQSVGTDTGLIDLAN